ncbi:MAG: twin-arginine translocase TatA/TatE family subunit [Anaerolineales bacterium]|nr:twin-arginine translocase TatA/TatE family subunit [Anaerolineales bacterium]
MDLLGIGPLELLFVLLIAFLVLGPENLEKTGKTLGRTLRNINQSETWEAVKSVTKEIQNLPTKLMREAAIEDYQKEQSDHTIAPPSSTKDHPETPDQLEAGLRAWTTPPTSEEDS